MSGIILARRSSGSGKRDPLAGVSPGDAFMGGFYVGIMDTTKSNIIVADASQIGLRYALIVSPKSLENMSLAYKTTNDAAPAASRTRWDGLTATQAMTGATYPAANYCNGLSFPVDGASQWYLGAIDENELVYRVLKPTTENNYTTASTGHEFPGGTQNQGYNPSSDPAGAAYTSSAPAQTTVAAFKSGGAQALDTAGNCYWTSTEYAASLAWMQYMSGSYAGSQGGNYKYNNYWTRPVRRLVLL